MHYLISKLISPHAHKKDYFSDTLLILKILPNFLRFTTCLHVERITSRRSIREIEQKSAISTNIMLWHPVAHYLFFNGCRSPVSRAARPSKTYLKVSVHCTTCFDRHWSSSGV
jgi:hypothetical protein